MANKGDCLQKGEMVKFQLCTVAQTGQKMACNIVPQRRALVECVKDQVNLLIQERNYLKTLAKVSNLSLSTPPVWFHHIRSWREQEAVFPCEGGSGWSGAPGR